MVMEDSRDEKKSIESREITPREYDDTASFAAALFGDIALALTGIPSGLGTLVSGYSAWKTRKESGALEEAKKELLRLKDEFEAFRARYEAQTDELYGRVDSCVRMILDAGKEPKEEFRKAKSRFAIRVLVNDLNEIDLYEVSKALESMTSLDFECLRAMVNFSFGSFEPHVQYAGIGFYSEYLNRALESDYPGITYDRISEVETRLQNLNLLSVSTVQEPLQVGHQLGTEKVSKKVSRVGHLLIDLTIDKTT